MSWCIRTSSQCTSASYPVICSCGRPPHTATSHGLPSHPSFVDQSGHVLLASLVFKAAPSVGILILSSLWIPLLVSTPRADVEEGVGHSVDQREKVGGYTLGCNGSVDIKPLSGPLVPGFLVYLGLGLELRLFQPEDVQRRNRESALPPPDACQRRPRPLASQSPACTKLARSSGCNFVLVVDT
ncbi:hypothetical protein B0H14DRAFT_2616542 [Mycena olivaceomarginata]|nr:hypothetical protein B0H14DRAFT_2616542 [Mycena olivaceomarginata]